MRASRDSLVVDGVNTGGRAGVTAGGAARSGRSLCRGVGDRVTSAGASALESVVETNPVTSLVGEGPAEVVVGGAIDYSS